MLPGLRHAFTQKTTTTPTTTKNQTNEADDDNSSHGLASSFVAQFSTNVDLFVPYSRMFSILLD